MTRKEIVHDLESLREDLLRAVLLGAEWRTGYLKVLEEAIKIIKEGDK